MDVSKNERSFLSYTRKVLCQAFFLLLPNFFFAMLWGR